MNICFVEFGYPTKNSGGGAGTYVKITAKELLKQGHKVFVISKYFPDESEEFIDEGIFIKRIKIKGWHWCFTKIPLIGKFLARFFRIIEYSIAINISIKNLHKKYRLDLVEFSETANFLYLFQIKLPYVVHLHGSSFTFKKYCGEKITLEDRLQRKLEGIFMKKSKLITSPSKFLKKEIINEFKINESKIEVIPHPVDDYLLTLSYKQKYNFKIVFYAGRLEKRKGVHILKESIPIIVKEYPNVKFWLFGSESEEITRKDLAEYFRNHNVINNVELYPFLKRDKMLKFLKESDICVVPSIWDNSPLIIYESMILGKAIVASNVGGIPELIINNFTGILVEPGNIKEFSNAIIKLLFNRDTCQTIGRKAQEFAIQMFNINKIVSRRLEIYKNLLKENNFL